MGRRAKDETIKVDESIYLRSVAEIYHCYFRIAGKQFRRSTKTSELKAAKLQALTWHRDAQRKLERGEEVECVSFTRLKRTYNQHLARLSKQKYHSETIERHFLPFFSKFDDISKIKKADILEYLKYRRAKSDQEPNPKTLNRENTVLRQLFRFAVDHGWLHALPEIPNQSEAQHRHRRRHFTLDEYRTLYKTARKRAIELDGNELTTRQSWQRKLLFDYILILANTGLRVDESKTLTWRNVLWEESAILLERAGKTKSSRRVLMRRYALVALKRIHERRLQYLKRNNLELDQNECVVALPNGKQVGTLKKGFNQLLDACGFVYKDIRDKHALTSLRHTYATFRLTTRSGKRASIRALAKQMGTSEKMIERHYGHDVVEDYREELAG